MCFAPDATPPPLPSGAQPIPGEDLRLTSADGTSYLTYQAKAAAPTGAAVVILPDVRGLFGFYKNLASYFAAAGIDAIAIDYFARTAPDDDRAGEFDPWPHVRQTTTPTVRADIAAAKTHISELPHVTSVFPVGFCFGGGHAFALAAAGMGFAAVVGLYGRPYANSQDSPSAIEVTDQMDCPLQGFFGGADAGIPVDLVGEFDDVLTESKVPHEIKIYDGAPHSYFDRSSAEWDGICQDTWTRMLNFISTNTAA